MDELTVIYHRKNWEELHEKALERLDDALIAVIAAEGAVKAIRREMVIDKLKEKGIFHYKCPMVRVDFKGSPNKLCILDRVDGDGDIIVRFVGAKGNLLKTEHHLSYKMLAHVRAAK